MPAQGPESQGKVLPTEGIYLADAASMPQSVLKATPEAEKATDEEMVQQLSDLSAMGILLPLHSKVTCTR